MYQHKNVTADDPEAYEQAVKAVLEDLMRMPSHPVTEVERLIYNYAKKWFTETMRPNGARSAKVIPVIVTEAVEGRGTEIDPCGIIVNDISFRT